MESFNDLLTKWQPFFTAVAGVAATLAGLLFVSLSLNREKITAHNNRILLRLAQRTFGDLLFTLFIALLFLVPNHHSFGLAIPLFTVTAARGFFIVRSFFRSQQDPLKTPLGVGGFREHAFQTISVLGLLCVAIAISRGNIIATFYLVPIIALLLYNASSNAWLLLVLGKNADELATKLSTAPEK